MGIENALRVGFEQSFAKAQALFSFGSQFRGVKVELLDLGPDVTSAWVRKYIFPGGYIPAVSQVSPAIERAGLWLTDLEILRLHYAETLRAWRERFLAHIGLIGQIYDERFCRMWEYYLAVSEMSFRYGDLMVFQAQLAPRVDNVPITRDYMFEGERRCDNSIAAV